MLLLVIHSCPICRDQNLSRAIGSFLRALCGYYVLFGLFRFLHNNGVHGIIDLLK